MNQKAIYDARKVERMKRNERIKCDGCCSNANEVELFHSVYIHGKYCQDCLDIESDGDGDCYVNINLNQYKL